VQVAIKAGIICFSHNYFQEALSIIQTIGKDVKRYFIGHLQRNKAKVTVQNFDRAESVDSLRLARALDRHAESFGKKIPVLVEISSGRELNKTGILPKDVDDFVRQINMLENRVISNKDGRFLYMDSTDSHRFFSYFATTFLSFAFFVFQYLPRKIVCKTCSVVRLASV